MEIYKVCFTVVAITLLMLSTVRCADPFTDAFKKINAVKPNINYPTFCSKEKPQGGEDKFPCRLKAVQSVVFLVCKKKAYDGKPCLNVIQDEVKNILILKKAGINTVVLAPKPSERIIEGVRCYVEKSIECSGFLEEWVPESTGQFEHIRDAIVYGTISDVIARVVKYTTGNLKNSARDLDNIVAYMYQGKYRQICDLQGFFLKNGGFKVNDVPEIKERMGWKERCEGDEPTEEEPTTQDVIEALEQMSKAFKGYKVKKSVLKFSP